MAHLAQDDLCAADFIVIIEIYSVLFEPRILFQQGLPIRFRKIVTYGAIINKCRLMAQYYEPLFAAQQMQWSYVDEIAVF